MSEESEDEKFTIEKVEVAGDVTKDSILSKSVRKRISKTRATTLRLRE